MKVYMPTFDIGADGTDARRDLFRRRRATVPKDEIRK